MVHIVRPNIPANLGVFVHPLQSLPFGVPVVLESDGVVRKSFLYVEYPLELAVRLLPMI
jgi:hypothetical protein